MTKNNWHKNLEETHQELTERREEILSELDGLVEELHQIDGGLAALQRVWEKHQEDTPQISGEGQAIRQLLSAGDLWDGIQDAEVQEIAETAEVAITTAEPSSEAKMAFGERWRSLKNVVGGFEHSQIEHPLARSVVLVLHEYGAPMSRKEMRTQVKEDETLWEYCEEVSRPTNFTYATQRLKKLGVIKIVPSKSGSHRDVRWSLCTAST